MYPHSQNEQNAYNEGYSAAIEGEGAIANPYVKLSEKWYSWQRGYNTAKYGMTLDP